MSNPGHTRPGGLRPQLSTLPDGRLRLVTLFRLASGWELTNDLIVAWGGLYSAIEKVTCTGKQAHLAGLRLVGGQEARQMQGGGDWVWVREYEELPASSEVQVGKNRRIIGDDGRIEIRADFLQLSSATRTPGTVAVTTPPAPDASAGVMATEDPQDDGAVRRIARVYVAAGLLSKSSRVGSGGLIDVTWVSVRTKQSPTFGALIYDEERNPNGIPVFTVTKRQSSTGGDPTGESSSFQRYVPFTYPGRAKPFVESMTVGTGDVRRMMDVYRQPPATIRVLATVAITYQTTNTVGTVTPALWNPTVWAVSRAQWVGFGNRPYNQVDPLPGYRVESGTTTTLTETCAVLAPLDLSIFGNPVFGNTTAKIIVAGGPASPGGVSGTAWTLDVGLSDGPVFEDLAGTKYYRKTQVTATIPAEAALPV